MRNTTINQPKIESLSVNSKTVSFACVEPDVMELIASIRWDAASILNWRLRSSAWIANQILMRMGGEFIQLELRMGDLARALRNDLSYDAGARWVSRLIQNLDEDQGLSGFEMVRINTRRPRHRNDGSFYNLPTLYQPGEFFDLYKAVQDAAIEIDLFKLKLKERRARQRTIIQTWLFSRGYVPIIREKKSATNKSENESAENPASLPCQKPCAHCSLNEAAKSATASEANGREELRGIPNESFEVELGKFADFFERYLRERGKIDKAYTYAIKRAHHALEIAEQSAADLIIREQTGNQLRLVGGQPR